MTRKDAMMSMKTFVPIHILSWFKLARPTLLDGSLTERTLQANQTKIPDAVLRKRRRINVDQQHALVVVSVGGALVALVGGVLLGAVALVESGELLRTVKTVSSNSLERGFR